MQYSAIFAFFALMATVVNADLTGRDRVFSSYIPRASPNPAPPTTTTPTPAGLLDVPFQNHSHTFVPSTKAEQDFLLETCYNALYYKIATSDFYDCSRLYQTPSTSNDTQEEPIYLEMRQKFSLKVAQFAQEQEKDTKQVKSCFKAHRNGNFTKKYCREFLVFPKFEIPRTPRESLRKEAFDNMLRWFCANEQSMTNSEEALCRDFNLKRVHECIFTQASKTDFCKLVLDRPEERTGPLGMYLGKLDNLKNEMLRDPWMQ